MDTKMAFKNHNPHRSLVRKVIQGSDQLKIQLLPMLVVAVEVVTALFFTVTLTHLLK